jgi:hypothetical protein
VSYLRNARGHSLVQQILRDEGLAQALLKRFGLTTAIKSLLPHHSQIRTLRTREEQCQDIIRIRVEECLDFGQVVLNGAAVEEETACGRMEGDS